MRVNGKTLSSFIQQFLFFDIIFLKLPNKNKILITLRFQTLQSPICVSNWVHWFNVEKFRGPVLENLLKILRLSIFQDGGGGEDIRCRFLKILLMFLTWLFIIFYLENLKVMYWFSKMAVEGKITDGGFLKLFWCFVAAFHIFIWIWIFQFPLTKGQGISGEGTIKGFLSIHSPICYDSTFLYYSPKFDWHPTSLHVIHPASPPYLFDRVVIPRKKISQTFQSGFECNLNEEKKNEINFNLIFFFISFFFFNFHSFEKVSTHLR